MPKIPAGEHGGGPGEASDVARARRHEPGLGAVGAAEPEIDENLARAGQHHACRLRRDQRLEMQDVDEAGFGELRLRQRRGHPQDRLIGKENGALGHGMHIAGEAELAQVVEQIPAELAGGLEPFEFRRREAKVFEVVERLLEAGRKEKAAAGGQAADEEFENGGFCLAMIQVGLHHVDLIKVGQQCARALRIHRLSLVFGPEPSANSARHRAGGD